MNAAGSLRALGRSRPARRVPPPTRTTAAWAALGIAVVLAVIYTLVGSPLMHGITEFLVGYLCVVAMIVGGRSSGARRPWGYIAAAHFMFVSGMSGYAFYFIAGSSPPSPSAADYLYLAGYPLMVAGLLHLSRLLDHGSRRFAHAVESSALALGLGALLWIIFIQPRLGEARLGALGQIVTALYPLLDVAMFASVARILVVGRGSSGRFLLLGAAGTMVAANTLYAVTSLGSDYFPGALVDIGYMISWILYGAAALRTAPRPRPIRASERHERMSRELWLYFGAAGAALLALAFMGARFAEVGIILVVVASGGAFTLSLTSITARLKEVDRARGNLLIVLPEAGQAEPRERGGPEPLSDRERAVLRLLTTELSLREIGETLFVSRNTVKTHTSSIYRKLGASSRSEAVETGRDRGLI